MSLDWSDPYGVWVELSLAGVLADNVSPRQLLAAHEAVEHDREVREWAEARYADFTGGSAPAPGAAGRAAAGFEPGAGFGRRRPMR